MKRSAIAALVASCLFTLAILAQEPAAENKIDDVSKEATRLEAELGKYKDSSPEAADTMVLLTNLYHKHGRVFGLIRVAQKFVSVHTSDPRHQDVMIKLIDGLEATSRNKDLTVICRQLLTRYPDAPNAPQYEIRLARTLDQMGDRNVAGDAHRTVWKRQPNTDLGRRHAIKAMEHYIAVNSKPVYSKAAEIAEQLIDQLPAGPFAEEIAWQAFAQWRRGSEWAKSNVVGGKMVKKNLASTKPRLRQLHYLMAQSYGSLGQWANAVDSYTKARALGDSQEVHYQIILSMYNNAATKPAEMAPLVADYFRKYPERRDRYYLQSLLAVKYRNSMDPANAQRIFAQLINVDARGNSNASHFLRGAGTEPAQLAAAVTALTNAIGQSTQSVDKNYLRYVLALELYRDRLKDPVKARQVCRQLLAETPTNEAYTQYALDYLLYNAATDQEFVLDVATILKSRQANLHLSTYRGMLQAWIARNKKNKDHKARAALAQTRLQAANNDPLYQAWIKIDGYNNKAQQGRDALIASSLAKGLSDDMAYHLLYNNAYYLRHYAPTGQRPRSVSAFGMLSQRFPKRYDAALWYLQAATDYGPKEVSKEAALHLLTFQPQYSDPDLYRRLVVAADSNADVELLKRVYSWILNSEKLHGPGYTYAYLIGDALLKHKLETEAVSYWQLHVAVNRDHYDSRYCAERLANRLEGAPRTQFIQGLFKEDSDYHGAYAMWLAGDYLKAGDLANFEKVLRETLARQKQRPFRGWGIEDAPVQAWVDQYRNNKEATEADKRRVFTIVRDLQIGRPSGAAQLALLELPATDEAPDLARLLQYQEATRMVYDAYQSWDRLMPYVQESLRRKDYMAAATLATGMLANIPSVDAGRKKAGRELVAQSYSRMGAVGLTIDENSEIAPLLQAALSLRLGDDGLAYETYLAHKALFDAHRNEVPVDLLVFICESHIAAGGDENHDRVEDILRGWIVKHSESNQFDTKTKAQVQLLLAKNFAKSRRFDIARSEYTTVINRYADTPQALEAEFGIGETFMAQKVYDQAEAVFEKLAGSRDADVVIRAEFLRGVLAHRRGDRDEARDIFRSVLERVPDIKLANAALFNLAEVYGDEERYIDQLNLLRTVGRLGRRSKRYHTPGVALSIVVQDSDLGISRGHTKIPVYVTTDPGGDTELIYLTSGGAGKGLFRADLDTQLGQVVKNDRVLQLTGKDTIRCDYPDKFKKEFKRVPLSDVDILIASDGKFEVASSKIIDKEKETFSEKLEREAKEAEDEDERVSQSRPANQIKPGNILYFKTQDFDRDLTDEFDKVTVKLTAESGDSVQVPLTETGPHTGIFEGTAKTGELPAGALASDTAIEHSPLMAIDRSKESFWMSEPDGATPKMLTVDMKDLKLVSRMKFAFPEADRYAPVRGDFYGSNDGRFWFKIASNPPQPPVALVADEYGKMTQRIYHGNYTSYTNWNQVVSLCRNSKPIEEDEAETLSWTREEESENAAKPFTAIWHGKLVQEREGAARIAVQGIRTAVAIDGRLELPVGPGNRTVDVWLERGTHDLTIFSANSAGTQVASATMARADHNSANVNMLSFRKSDFDLDQPFARPALAREAVKADFGPTEWTLQFEARELRYVRFEVQEYLGEAVAISNVEISGEEADQLYIPTEADVLALSNNDVLEIAGGDVVTATYTDEFTQRESASSRLLTAKLTATYYDAAVQSIGYDFIRNNNGAVTETRKQVMRIDPGERFVVEIVDYDRDQTGQPDTLKFDVIINDGAPVEFTATETEEYSGVFTKEIDTSAQKEENKFTVQKGDRIYVRYIDSQNTFPGHAVPRETVVHVNKPTDGQIRIFETRVIPPPPESKARPSFVYLYPDEEKDVSNVAFEAPLTVEVIDPDAAKDSRSSVTVTLTTSDGSKVDVKCIVSNAFTQSTQGGYESFALEEGRFIGQVILQLGSKASSDLVPVTADMPRSVVGGPIIEDTESALDRTLITRVLNVTGKDKITSTYHDTLRPEGPALDLTSDGRLITNGTLLITDRDYSTEVTRLHVGEKLFMVVTDFDQDTSDERDVAKVEITSEFGEKESVELAETLAHSGIFTGSFTLKSNEKPTPGNLNPEDAVVECYFGDTLHLRYTDKAASTESGELEEIRHVPVVVGTDGLVAAFSKTFNDEKLAVETKFHIAESYFELFKSHKELGRKAEQTIDLEAGRRILGEVMEDYPDPKYIPRIAYLFGQFAQELEHWGEAIDSYEMIVRQYPEHSLAPDAQYKLAQAHEEAGDFDKALEEYVTLAATYPKNPLIASVMIRISDHFYKKERYDIAAQVGEKFLEKFENHQHASRIAFRVGQCFYKAKTYNDASDAFDRFAKRFPDDQMCSDALFWSGESFRMGNNNVEAFRRYNRCRWDFPASEAAKYARGRLALPEMLQQFEAEARNLEDQ